MTFERFSEKFLQGLKENGLEVESLETQKVNETLTAICIKDKTELIQPTLYLERLHKAFESGVNMEQLVRDTAYTLTHANINIEDIPELNRDTAQQRLFCTVINKDLNTELIANVPHQDMLDLSLIARFRVFEHASILVNNDICGKLKLTSEEVMQIAKENTFAEQYKCVPMSDMLKEYLLQDGMPPEFISDVMKIRQEECPMYVLTNNNGVNGATMMVSKNVLDSIYEEFGDNFYILPSSLHEVILIPESFSDDVEMYRDMVVDVNGSFLEAEDKLTDNVYHYDGITRSLTIAGQSKMEDVCAVKSPVKGR